MKPRNLLQEPYFGSKDLGLPIPDSPHAVSVCLPRWKDIIDYEEKNPILMNKLQSIYPRFGLNPLIKEVTKYALIEANSNYCNAWPYSTQITAKLAQEHCRKKAPIGNTLVTEVLGLFCLLTDERSTNAAKCFWQHSGLGASSRDAAIALGKEKAPCINKGIDARQETAIRLAKIYNCKINDIRIYPSGMAALFSALELIRRFRPGKKALQLGFPYVDVLKLPDVVFEGSELLLKTNSNDLIEELDRRNPSVIIIELPSNPMLKCIDLPSVSKIAHARGIPIIVDDTIGSPLNIDTLPYADLIFSSLTKSFAGTGDILAGSLVVSPYSPWYKELINYLDVSLLPPLGDADAIVLEAASRDASFRIPLLNDACEELAGHLSEHPAVKRVLHPKGCENFEKLMREDSGYGCLLSFELKDGLNRVKKVYDALELCKGPSLGTRFTLVCPYVMLAHYHELDWAKECGIPSHLLRVSVGLEDPQNLWETFRSAFKA